MSITKSELNAALETAFGKQAWLGTLALIATLEVDGRTFHGQVEAAIAYDVREYCTVEQLAEGIAKVAALPRAQQVKLSDGVEAAQKSKAAFIAFPKAAPKAAKIEIVSVAKPRRSRCGYEGCQAWGNATTGGMCRDCWQDSGH